jgi:hypothetical protein
MKLKLDGLSVLRVAILLLAPIRTTTYREFADWWPVTGTVMFGLAIKKIYFSSSPRSPSSGFVRREFHWLTLPKSPLQGQLHSDRYRTMHTPLRHDPPPGGALPPGRPLAVAWRFPSGASPMIDSPWLERSWIDEKGPSNQSRRIGGSPSSAYTPSAPPSTHSFRVIGSCGLTYP